MPWEDYVIEGMNAFVDKIVDGVDAVSNFSEDVNKIAEQIDVLEKGD